MCLCMVGGVGVDTSIVGLGHMSLEQFRWLSLAAPPTLRGLRGKLTNNWVPKTSLKPP